MLLHIIADYGAGDLAFAEVVQRLQTAIPNVQPVLTSVPAFSTLAAGFCIAQLALNEPARDMVVYHNVAPRDDDDEMKRAQPTGGERLAFARLDNGVRVIGVNSGFSLSFIRDVALELRWVNVESSASQFRSRDLFPRIVAAVASGSSESLGSELERSSIPDIPQNCIAYVDGYGNLKTTIALEQTFSEDATISQAHVNDIPGRMVSVRVGEIKKHVVIHNASFDAPPGQITLAPGSSGWVRPEGRERRREIRWMELFFRSGSAWQEFGRPPIGTPVEITYPD